MTGVQTCALPISVEAQIGVSIDVAEGIVSALKGEPVMTAVNMAPVSPQVMNVIKPFFDLAERLGCMAGALAEGAVRAVEVEYTGDITDVNTKLLTTAVLKGLLNPILETTVNYVNAPSLAKDRGITVREVKSKEAANFTNLSFSSAIPSASFCKIMLTARNTNVSLDRKSVV